MEKQGLASRTPVTYYPSDHSTRLAPAFIGFVLFS